MKTFVLSAVVLFCCVSLAMADQVITRDDEVLEGEIQAMNYKELTINQTISGSIIPRRIDAWEIAEINLRSRKNMPPELAAALSKFRVGNYKDALARFESVSQNRGVSDVARQFAYWHLALSHFKSRNPEKTREALQSIRKAYEDTFYLREAYDVEYDLARSTGDAQAMTRVVGELKKKATQLKIKTWKQAAEMKEAELNEFKGNPAGAQPIYARYRKDKAFGTQAKLGELRCLSIQKKHTEAVSRAKGILKEVEEAKEDPKKNPPPHPRLIMAAYNALGDNELAKDRVKPAFMNYLRVVADISLRHPGSPEHEEAIAKAAMAMARYAMASEEAEEKETYGGRAGALLEELKANFGENSPWVKKVEAALKAE